MCRAEGASSARHFFGPAFPAVSIWPAPVGKIADDEQLARRAVHDLSVTTRPPTVKAADLKCTPIRCADRQATRGQSPLAQRAFSKHHLVRITEVCRGI